MVVNRACRPKSMAPTIQTTTLQIPAMVKVTTQSRIRQAPTRNQVLVGLGQFQRTHHHLRNATWRSSSTKHKHLAPILWPLSRSWWSRTCSRKVRASCPWIQVTRLVRVQHRARCLRSRSVTSTLACNRRRTNTQVAVVEEAVMPLSVASRARQKRSRRFSST